MRTRYKIVDMAGDPINLSHLAPYTPIPVEMVSAELIPSTGDPEDPDDVDVLEITVRYRHDLPKEKK